MYVVGEMYAPLGGEPGKKSAQKLLQAEKILQFLAAKENKPVSECVLGVVFMGSSMNMEMGGRLYSTLFHYSKFLPCLWSLCNLRRVLGQCVQNFQPSVELMLTNANMKHGMAAIKVILRASEEEARKREEETQCLLKKIRASEEEARKREEETQRLLKKILEREGEKMYDSIAGIEWIL